MTSRQITLAVAALPASSIATQYGIFDNDNARHRQLIDAVFDLRDRFASDIKSAAVVVDPCFSSECITVRNKQLGFAITHASILDGMHLQHFKSGLAGLAQATREYLAESGSEK